MENMATTPTPKKKKKSLKKILRLKWQDNSKRLAQLYLHYINHAIKTVYLTSSHLPQNTDEPSGSLWVWVQSLAYFGFCHFWLLLWGGVLRAVVCFWNIFLFWDDFLSVRATRLQSFNCQTFRLQISCSSL